MSQQKLVDMVITAIAGVDKAANKRKFLVIKSADDIEKAETKREGGEDFPAAAFAHVPDPKKPSTWKLRLWDSLKDKTTAAQVGRAVAALGEGFRGNKVEISEADLVGVKARVKAAWKATHPEAKADEIPAVLKGEVSKMPEERQSIFKRAFEGIRKMMGMGGKGMTMDQMMATQEKENELRNKEWEYRDAFDSSVRSIMNDDAMDMEKKKEMLGQTLEQYQTKLMEHMDAMMGLMQQTTAIASMEKAKMPPGTMKPGMKPDMDSEDEMDEDGMPKKTPPIKKGDEVTMTLEEFLKGLKAEDRVTVEAEIAKRVATPTADIAKRLDELEKSAGQVVELQKRATEAETKLAKAETDLAAEREVRVSREYLEKAVQYPSAGDAQTVAATLRKAYSAGEDVGKAVEDSMAKAEAAVKESALFKEIGKGGHGPAAGSAEAKLDTLAKNRVEKGQAKTYQQAYADAVQENPDLYTQSLKEAN